MSRTVHRPAPDPPQPSTVVDQSSTVAAAAQDYAGRSGCTTTRPSSYGATPHTLGRQQ